MQKIITIISILSSLNANSQVTVFQTVKIFKPNRDSCLIVTQLNNNREKIFKSEVKCKTIESDSLSSIELRKTKLIRENINWTNKK